MVKKASEQRTVLTFEGTVTRVNVSKDGKSVEIFTVPDCIQTQNESKTKSSFERDFDEKFPIVRASTLSLEDLFMKYTPETPIEKRLKASIVEGIKGGLKDFRRPAMDPSFDKLGNYTYSKGEKPATGKSPQYGQEKLKEFMPKKNSRMGSLREYDAFLGILIKYLVEAGYYVDVAWRMVCNDSVEVGHYWDSRDPKREFEYTGSRRVGRFYDLANTRKIVLNKYTTSGFGIVSGSFDDFGKCYPLAGMDDIKNPNKVYENSVPWLVMDV